jgi:hypothetical protein
MSEADAESVALGQAGVTVVVMVVVHADAVGNAEEVCSGLFGMTGRSVVVGARDTSDDETVGTALMRLTALVSDVKGASDAETVGIALTRLAALGVAVVSGTKSAAGMLPVCLSPDLLSQSLDTYAYFPAVSRLRQTRLSASAWPMIER